LRSATIKEVADVDADHLDVLYSKETADIRRKLDEGWRGPVLVTRLYRLLDDREERVRRDAAGAAPNDPTGVDRSLTGSDK